VERTAQQSDGEPAFTPYACTFVEVIGHIFTQENGIHQCERLPVGNPNRLVRAGGQWEPGSRRWLIERRRIGPVIRTLERNVDPLVRVAGLTLG
jgi:hypothetical protein